MIRFFTCWSLAFLLHVSASAQKTTVGAEIGVAADFIHIDDPAGHLIDPSLSAALLGIKVRHAVAAPLFLETGLYTRIYREGFLFKDDIGASITGRRAFMLPLRAGLRFPLFKNKLAVSPVAGYVLALANDQEASNGWNDGGDPNVGVRYTLQTKYPTQAFSMVQGGVSVEIRVFKKASLSFTGNYFAGLDKLWIQQMQYTVDGGAQQSATQYSKGSFYSVGLGFSYPVGLL